MWCILEQIKKKIPLTDYDLLIVKNIKDLQINIIKINANMVFWGDKGTNQILVLYLKKYSGGWFVKKCDFKYVSEK